MRLRKFRMVGSLAASAAAVVGSLAFANPAMALGRAPITPGDHICNIDFARGAAACRFARSTGYANLHCYTHVPWMNIGSDVWAFGDVNDGGDVYRNVWVAKTDVGDVPHLPPC